MRAAIRRSVLPLAAAAAIACTLAGAPQPASAGMDPFIGEIALVPYHFAPRFWAFCEGQTMSIAQNTALFSLLGTTYGGDGRTTFNLPDLRGRVAIGAGQGPGLSSYSLGETGGVEAVTLTGAQMPFHSHSLAAQSGAGNVEIPGAATVLARNPRYQMYSTAAPNVTMSPTAIAAAGGSQPHENRQPYLVLNYIIALYGIFPSRN